MKVLQEKMPTVRQYIDDISKMDSKPISNEELIDLVDLVVNICIGCAGVMNVAQAMAQARQMKAVDTILDALEKETEKHGAFHSMVVAAYVDKQMWSQTQHVRNRVDQLAKGDPDRRKIIVEVFEKYLSDIDVGRVVTDREFNQFAEQMEKAETEIESLNL